MLVPAPSYVTVCFVATVFVSTPCVYSTTSVISFVVDVTATVSTFSRLGAL